MKLVPTKNYKKLYKNLKKMTASIPIIIKIKNKIHSFKFTDDVILDLSDCVFIDHSVIETLYHIKNDFSAEGGSLTILGIEELKNVGNSVHHLAARRRK